jgi:galactosylceramidase
LRKPVWNSEEHIYKSGFDCEISIVQGFNLNYIRYGTSLVVNWYGIAGVYPEEPYSETPAALLARSPWSGNYSIREALWGYAHYGQFTSPGWRYLRNGAGTLESGGSYVSLKSPSDDYSIIVETKDAKRPQRLDFELREKLSRGKIHIWRSNAREQFVEQAIVRPVHGKFTLLADPDSIYSLTTTSGQQKGSFPDVPAAKPFPFPYYETFDEYTSPADYGYLPRYTADIDDVFEIVDSPDRKGMSLQQVVPARPNSWAPEWLPYTILGDEHWKDYEVGVDVYLNPSETAGIMGRVMSVGSGYGTVPRGYYLTLSDDGVCRLVVVRGKKDKNAVVGDAEQQALIHSGKDFGPGGELTLGSIQLKNIHPREWHELKLRFEGQKITGFVDDQPALTAEDDLYPEGMVGLLAGASGPRLSRPYYKNLLVNRVASYAPAPTPSSAGQIPIYQSAEQSASHLNAPL